MKKFLLFIVSLSVMTSCYTTWTTVGNYTQLEKSGLKSYKYDKKKQFYLFQLIPLGHAHAKTPNEPCEIVGKMKFVDYVIPTVTVGLLGARTVTVYALKGAEKMDMETPENSSSGQTTTVSSPRASSTPMYNGSMGTFKEGDRVLYQQKGQWWYYATIVTISGNVATIRLQDSNVTIDRNLNEIMKVEYIH